MWSGGSLRKQNTEPQRTPRRTEEHDEENSVKNQPQHQRNCNNVNRRGRGGRRGRGWNTRKESYQVRMDCDVKKYFLALTLFGCMPVSAQEILSIDLRGVEQRIRLQNPPAPPSDCVAGKPCMMRGGSVSGSVSDGAPDIRDPRALAV
jgi:hypothetical protein